MAGSKGRKKQVEPIDLKRTFDVDTRLGVVGINAIKSRAGEPKALTLSLTSSVEAKSELFARSMPLLKHSNANKREYRS